jgi:ribonuclease III
MELDIVQQNLNYFFRDERILKIALTHKSYLTFRKREKTANEHNERLEFLGDAVLELIVTDYLYTKKNEPEGVMTALRSSLVNYKTVGQIGIDLGLDEIIRLSPGEKAELGKARLTIVADAVEAVIGAIYIDGGYKFAEEFVVRQILSKLEDIISSESFKDAKTELQEFTQKQLKLAPRYETLATEGKDHNKTFFVAVFLGEKKYGEGSGKSKQEAETECAIQALEKLNNPQDNQEINLEIL